MAPRVLVIMGSDSDFPVMKECVLALREFQIPCEVRVCSAHRTPEAANSLARDAEKNGFRVIIAGAGAAAHLAGVMAASSNLPVIGVPIESSALHGVDALYSTAQMPAGVPVAAMGIGKAGARNAGLFAAQILALNDAAIAEEQKAYRRRLADQVAAKDTRLRQELDEMLEDS